MKDTRPWTVAKIAKTFNTSQPKVRRMVKLGELDQFPVRGDALLITAGSVERALRSGAFEDRRNTKR